MNNRGKEASHKVNQKWRENGEKESKFNDFYLCHVCEVGVFSRKKFPLCYFSETVGFLYWAKCAKCVSCVFALSLSGIIWNALQSHCSHQRRIWLLSCLLVAVQLFRFVTCDNRRNSNKRTRHTARHTHKPHLQFYLCNVGSFLSLPALYSPFSKQFSSSALFTSINYFSVIFVQILCVCGTFSVSFIRGNFIRQKVQQIVVWFDDVMHISGLI